MNLLIGLIILSIGALVIIMTAYNSKSNRDFKLMSEGISMMNFGVSLLLVGAYVISEMALV